MGGGEPMTNEELLQAYRNDPSDTDTLHQLFVQNEGLIRKTASEVAHIYNAKQNDQMEDLISEGNLALLEVVVGNSYDPTKGKLMTYALTFIRGAMCRWLEKNLGTMEVSKHQMEKIRRVQQMYYEYNYDATTIAQEMKLSLEETAQLLLYNTHPISLDDLKAALECTEENFANGNASLMPTAENVEHTVMNEIWLSLLPEVFNSLKIKERYILGHYYGLYDYEKKLPEELGLELELTMDGVYKARDAALRRLKQQYYGTPLHIWRRAYVDTKLVALKGSNFAQKTG